jgi:flagellar assembly protein FliH
MSSSSSTGPATAVVRGDRAAALEQVRVPELDAGTWTRLGDPSVHGDAVTERALNGLAGSTRDAARAQGYPVGWAEGRRRAAEEARLAEAERAADWTRTEELRAAEHAAALVALAEAARGLREQAAAVARQVEDAALALARELTRALVGHELRVAEDPGADTVRRALLLLPEGSADELPVTLRLHPDVAGAPVAQDLRGHGIRVVGDPALAMSDALVETDEAVVDARLTAALERVLAVLS